jgi:hypothetical protein
MFEYHISKQERILNQLLDKINKNGKNSLSKKELSFLDNYPNEELSNKSDKIVIKNKKQFSDELFEFFLTDIDIDSFTKDIIITGDFYYKNKKISGYFIVNQETEQIFPYFYDDMENTIYDIAKGYEDNVYNFLENIYFDLTKNKK